MGRGRPPFRRGVPSPQAPHPPPNFAEPNLIHSAYQVARLRGVARGGSLYVGMRFGSAKFLCFWRGFFGYVRLPCSAKNLYLPRHKKLPHKTPATTKAKQIFARVMAGVLWGSSGWVREVWRVGRPLRKGSPCASKVFPFPYPSIAFLISACVSGIEPEALTIAMRSRF